MDESLWICEPPRNSSSLALFISGLWSQQKRDQSTNKKLPFGEPSSWSFFLLAYCFYNARIYSTILPKVVIHSVSKTLTPHRELRRRKRQSQTQSLRAWFMADCTCLLVASWQKELCPLVTLLGCSEPAQCIAGIPAVERLTAWGGVLKNLGELLQKSRLDFRDLWGFISFSFHKYRRPML